MALQVRRGTNAERLAITPLEGELVFTTDTKQLYVGDGATAGGITSIANTIDSLFEDKTPQLGGQLELNGNNINGPGNVNITGNVTATAFIGDGSGLTGISGVGGVGGSISIGADDSTVRLIGPGESFLIKGGTNVTTTSDAEGNITIVSVTELSSDTTPQLGGGLDLNGNDITGTGNINITGNITGSGNLNITGNIIASGTINLGDGVGDDVLVIGGTLQGHLVPNTSYTYNLGSSTKQFNEGWISSLNVENQLTVGDINGNLVADDSTVVFNSSTGLIAAAQLTGTFTGDVIGNITGNANGSHTGTFDGDVTGSVFGDNSTLIVDGVNNTLYGNLTGDVDGDLRGSVFLDNSSLVIDGQFGDVYPRKIVSDGLLRITTPAAATTNFIQMESNDQYTSLALLRTSDSDLTGTNQRYGQLRFGKNDSSGRTDSNIISGNEDFLWIFNGADGVVADSKLLALSEGDVGIGTVTPAAKLDVQGAIKPGVYADNTARDAAITSPVAGMMIFNTTGTKFQGYTGSAWVDLN